jgi:hypothetical protein
MDYCSERKRLWEERLCLTLQDLMYTLLSFREVSMWEVGEQIHEARMFMRYSHLSELHDGS